MTPHGAIVPLAAVAGHDRPAAAFDAHAVGRSGGDGCPLFLDAPPVGADTDVEVLVHGDRHSRQVRHFPARAVHAQVMDVVPGRDRSVRRLEGENVEKAKAPIVDDAGSAVLLRPIEHQAPCVRAGTPLCGSFEAGHAVLAARYGAPRVALASGLPLVVGRAELSSLRWLAASVDLADLSFTRWKIERPSVVLAEVVQLAHPLAVDGSLAIRNVACRIFSHGFNNSGGALVPWCIAPMPRRVRRDAPPRPAPRPPQRRGTPLPPAKPRKAAKRPTKKAGG